MSHSSALLLLHPAPCVVYTQSAGIRVLRVTFTVEGTRQNVWQNGKMALCTFMSKRVCAVFFSFVVLCVISFCLTAFMGIRWSAGPCVNSGCLTLCAVYVVGPLIFSVGPPLPAAVISAVWETQHSAQIQLPSPLYLSVCLSICRTYAMSLDNTLSWVSFTFPIKQEVMAGSGHEPFHTLSHTSALEWEWPWDGICTTQQSSFSPGFRVADVSLVT